jgi:Helix-turn-helix domain
MRTTMQKAPAPARRRYGEPASVGPERSKDGARQDLSELSLREIRELTGHTQAAVAAAANMRQSDVSRLERMPLYKLSTLRRIVAALGGEVEVTVQVGAKRMRLRMPDR